MPSLVTPVLTRHRHNIDVISHLVVREVHLRYRRSLFGWLWTVAQPLSRFLVLSFVFVYVLPLRIPNYELFLFSGLIGWMWFSAAVQSATASAVDRRDLLMRPGISPMVVPTISVLTDAIDYVAALPVLALFLLLSDGIPWTWVLLPAVLFPMFMLALGLGYALCSANVYLRDVRIVVGVATLLGFYLTPVFYQAEAIPEDFRWVLTLNPVATLLELQRDVLVRGVLPDLSELGTVFAIGAVALVSGAAIYRRASRTFLDEL